GVSSSRSRRRSSTASRRRSRSRGSLLPMPIVTTEDRNTVRHVVLNRPDKRNAMNGELVQALGVELTAAANDPDVHCVVIRGEGPMFSSGMDFSDLVALSDAPENLRAFRRAILEVWNLCDEMAKA